MIVVVGNLKGGTGKSTAVFNLALWHAHNVGDGAVCDLDPQATLRDAIEVREEEEFEPRLDLKAELPTRKTGPTLVDVGMWDTPAMRAALRRAERVLIPVAPSQADVWSTQRFLDIVADATKGKKTPELLAFISRADTHPGSRENEEAAEALTSIPGLKLLKSRLSQRIAFRRSFSEGLAVFELEPSGKAAAELNALAREVFG
jgi:chromosome partitioning protein